MNLLRKEAFPIVILVLTALLLLALAAGQTTTMEEKADLFELEAQIVELEERLTELEEYQNEQDSYISVGLYSICYNQYILGYMLGIEPIEVEDCLIYMGETVETMLNGDETYTPVS